MRLQLSMLLLPMTTRVNFWAMKFISFVVFEQLNMPNPFGPNDLTASNPSAAHDRASSHEAGRRRPPSLTKGWVRRSSGPGSDPERRPPGLTGRPFTAGWPR